MDHTEEALEGQAKEFDIYIYIYIFKQRENITDMIIALLRDSSFGSFVKESARKKYQMQLGDCSDIGERL